MEAHGSLYAHTSTNGTRADSCFEMRDMGPAIEFIRLFLVRKLMPAAKTSITPALLINNNACGCWQSLGEHRRQLMLHARHSPQLYHYLSVLSTSSLFAQSLVKQLQCACRCAGDAFFCVENTQSTVVVRLDRKVSMRICINKETRTFTDIVPNTSQWKNYLGLDF